MWRKAMTAALAVATLTACQDTGGSTTPAGAGAPAGKPAPSRPITGDAAPGIDVGAVNREVLDFLNQKGDYAGTYPKTTKVRDPLHGGATVAVTKGGKLVLSKGYGWSDKDESEPMEPTHRSRIGSVSKIPTAIGILQLVEQGKLDLDASVYGDPGPFVDLNTPWPPVSKSNWASSQAVLDDPELYWAAIRDGVTEMTEPNFVNSGLNKLRGWISAITVRHLLSHTSGMLRETKVTQVDDFYGRWMRDYRGVHTAVLRGVTKDDKGNRQAPFEFAPGTGRVYSNHAYVLLGLIVEQVSDGRLYYGYHDYTIREVFRRLGLDDVVVNNTHLDDGLDAWPHGDDLDPDTKYRFPSTGAWSATAQDLTRIMCGLDQGSNHLRLLDADTVDVMHDIPFPAADGKQPHGWDSRPASYERYKNGKITGGSSVVLKFLPGKFSSAPDEEINVAVAVNTSTVPSTTLVRRIAQIVADATVASGYDLFDPEHRCVTEGPTVTITDPNNGTKFEVGEEIMVEAKAHDADGDRCRSRGRCPVTSPRSPSLVSAAGTRCSTTSCRRASTTSSR